MENIRQNSCLNDGFDRDPYSMSIKELNRFFSYNNWSSLSLEQKSRVLNALESKLAFEQGRTPHPVACVPGLTPDDQGCLYGYWSSSDGVIIINGDMVENGFANYRMPDGSTIEYSQDDAIMKIYDTIVHEGRHSYQEYAVQHPEIHPDKDELAQWEKNMSGQIINGKHEDNYYKSGKEYLLNPIEVDARDFAVEKTSAAMNQIIDEYGEQPGYDDYCSFVNSRTKETVLADAMKTNPNIQEEMEWTMNNRIEKWQRGESCGEIDNDTSYRQRSENIETLFEESPGNHPPEHSPQENEPYTAHQESESQFTSAESTKYSADYSSLLSQLTEEQKDDLRQSMVGRYSDFSYEYQKALGNPYKFDESQYVKRKSLGGSDMGHEIAARETYQKSANSLFGCFPELYSNPDEKNAYFYGLSRIQEELGYYPELDDPQKIKADALKSITDADSYIDLPSSLRTYLIQNPDKAYTYARIKNGDLPYDGGQVSANEDMGHDTGSEDESVENPDNSIESINKPAAPEQNQQALNQDDYLDKLDEQPERLISQPQQCQGQNYLERLDAAQEPAEEHTQQNEKEQEYLKSLDAETPAGEQFVQKPEEENTHEEDESQGFSMQL